MNLRSIARSALAALTALIVGGAQASLLFTQPSLPGISGLQADSSTGSLAQAHTVAPGSTLGAIEWYGYHLPGSFGPGSDDFTVLVNGIDVSAGALSASIVFSSGGINVYRYTLDIVDIPITSGMLELSNGPDTQWAWQYSVASAGLQAFTLIGAAASVPEPDSVALLVLGLALAAYVRAGARRLGAD